MSLPARTETEISLVARALQRQTTQGWTSAQSLVLLAVATLLCLLPFSGKAFHIDDPLFLWSAQHITKHPLDPFGFNVTWLWQAMPMSAVTKNPPLACYYAAAIGSIFGWSERALHLGFLLPAVAMVLGTYRLAQRFTSSPLLAAAATLLTPGVLVSATSVMCDTVMLAFWIWAIVAWMEGMESGKGHLLLVSGVLMSGAALSKYFGICLVPLLFAYSLAKQRKLGVWVWYFAVPIAALGAYQIWTHALYGRAMFSEAVTFAPQRLARWRDIVVNPVVCLSFIGGCTLPALLLAPLVWVRKHIFIALLTLGLAIAAAWLVAWPHIRSGSVGRVVETQGGVLVAEFALFVACGASVLVLAAVDVWVHRDADSLLLGLWVLGTFAFTAFLNWTINARSVLPLIPATGILLARRLDWLGIASARSLQWKVAVAMIVSGAISFWVARADAEWANSARETAGLVAQRSKDECSTVWFEGHWGFQYYMQQAGMRPFDFTASVLQPEDCLVVPNGNYLVRRPPMTSVASEEVLESRLRQAVILEAPSLGAGFYASFRTGWLPFRIGVPLTERYSLFRVARTLQPEDWQKPAVAGRGLEDSERN